MQGQKPSIPKVLQSEIGLMILSLPSSNSSRLAKMPEGAVRLVHLAPSQSLVCIMIRWRRWKDISGPRRMLPAKA